MKGLSPAAPVDRRTLLHRVTFDWIGLPPTPEEVEAFLHVHDLHAPMLHLLGFDHEKFTYRYAGREFRLTDVHGHVVRDVLA